MAKGWGPVVLGVNKPELNEALKKALDDAKTKGVPNAQGAKVEAAEGEKVEFHGINDEAAKTLWNHMEPIVKGHLPNATIKLQ